MPGFGCSKSEPAPEPSTMPCRMCSCHLFGVVAKTLTMATNFLRLFKAGSSRLAIVLGASRVLGWD